MPNWGPRRTESHAEPKKRSSTRRTAKRSLLRIRRQQNDLPDTAFLTQHMGFSRIAQRHAPANRQNELAIAYVIGKLAYLRWVGLSTHTRNLHRRVLSLRSLREHRRVAKGPARLYPRDQLCRNLAANSVRNDIHQGEFRNRLVVIDREHIRDPES